MGTRSEGGVPCSCCRCRSTIAVLLALVSGDMTQLITTSGALASLWSAGVLSWRALVAEARYFLGERTDPPKLPLKLISTALTALGAGLAATAGGHGIASAAVFAALAARRLRVFLRPRPEAASRRSGRSGGRRQRSRNGRA